jgi:transmembrane sensor
VTPRPPDPPADLSSVRRPSVESLDEGLLDRWLRGAATEADAALIAQWIALDPQRGVELRALEAVARTPRGDVPAIDSAAQYRRFLARRGPAAWLAQEAREQATRPRESRELGHTPPHLWRRGAETRGHSSTRRAWPLVGAFAAGICAALGVAMTHRHLATLLRGTAWREYTTGAGERTALTLSDGTQLLLAPASRVRVAAGYGRTRRDVSIEGEAYFTVVHDSQHPFAVHAGNAMAEDLGTRFVMRSYPGEPVVRVVVADGTVSLGDTRARQDQRSILTSGTLGEVDRGGVSHVTTGVNPDNYISWTRGELRFVKTPLRDALAELGRWYDLDIRLADPVLGHELVTASYPGTSVDGALMSLADAFGAQWQRTGHVIVFSVRRHQSTH